MPNLYYFPTVDSSNAFPIGFFSPPKLTPDNSLAILSTERYVTQNQSDIYTYTYSPSGLTVVEANASLEFPGTTIGSDTVGGFSIPSGPLDVQSGDVQFSWLNSPIVFLGVDAAQNNSFNPVISTGMVWRFYQVSNNEPEWSWLRKAGLQAGDEVFLGYSVPEAYYGSSDITDASEFDTCKTSTWIEDTHPSGPHTIKFTRPLKYLNSITINGTVNTVNVGVDGQTSLVRGIDPVSNTITLRRTLDPNDKITLNYEVYTEFYRYSGYKYVDADYNVTWQPCDLNPGYGREISDQVTGTVKPSSVGLFNQVLIYLIPVCFCKLNFTSAGTADSATLNGSLTFDSAFNYQETHFVRHYIGETNEVFDEDLGFSYDDFWNYWGVAPFGQSEYDESGTGQLVDDVFSTFLPSMMPIGKILLGGPGSIESVKSVDIRPRGGGVPETYSIPALQGTGYEDELRNLWDFGNWPGKLYHEGGSFTVGMDKSILDTYTQQQVEELVAFYTPPGVKAIIEYT